MNFWAKKRKGDLVFESNLVLSQRGIRAMPHAIPQTHSSVYCFYPHRFKSEIHVFLFIESWSRDQLMQKDLLTWLENLLFLDKRVFLTRLGLRFTYVTWLVSKWQAWLHVGGALGERHEINKSWLEIFDCILLSNRMIRLWKFYSCSFIPNWTRLFKFACNTDLNDNFRRQIKPAKSAYYVSSAFFGK